MNMDEKIEFLNDWNEDTEKELTICPLVPLRDTVVYPRILTPLYIGRETSIKAIEAALSKEDRLIVVAQRDADIEMPRRDDLYHIGTEVTVGRMLRMPDGTTNILAQGMHRVEISKITSYKPYMRCRYRRLVEHSQKTLAVEALMRAVLALFEKNVQLNHNLTEDAFVAAMNIDEPGWLADMVMSVMDLELEKRQQMLETIDPAVRLEKLSILLGQELDVLQLESRIQDQVQQEVDKSQREYFLREQMRVIQGELGEIDSQLAETNELQQKLNEAKLPDDVRAKAEKEVSRLVGMPSSAPEVAIIRTYVDWLLDLPWLEETEDNLEIAQVEKVLNSHHFGLPKAKDRILEYIAVRGRAASKMRSPILCFMGPPGTGKTSLGKSIAEALGRKFLRVSLGGIHDEAEIRGHRRTYIGAMPGRILQAMRHCGSINPLFMLDEIDKVGADFRGDPSAALLEVLDPEQNHSFSDHYLEMSYNLSKVLFITTANIMDTIPPALQDRMEVIYFPGYIEEEKLEIAHKFLIPRQIEEHGLQEEGISFSEGSLQTIIRDYTYEAGVRNLERCLGQVCRKIARKLAEGKKVNRRISSNALNHYLGAPDHIRTNLMEEDEVGVATGIAWTEAGGDLMAIEVSIMQGKGNLTLTGQLGEIMQESAQAALSFTRAHADEFGIADIDFDLVDIHLHVPEGAIPKDGPSAGVTIATAMISALSGRKVRHDLAMTGEITLRGRLLPVGGIKEKSLAAHRAGLRKIIMPQGNRKDMVDIPAKMRKEMNFIFVDRAEEVIAQALLPIEGTRKALTHRKPKARAKVEEKPADN
jgi:ATP-dependent Lon protease